MQVEVWSDVLCPFCYIGKRNYEAALQQFAGHNDVEIVWKSFQLDPTIPEGENKMDVYEYLSTRKGISRQQLAQMHQQVTLMAKGAGLDYHLENSIIANSFKAHRVLQFANAKGLGDKAEEVLFYANFTEGKDFGSTEVLVELGQKIGLTEAEVHEALTNDMYAYAVKSDIQEAQQIGVTGVPFFVFNRQQAVSGAQPPRIFLEVLQKTHADWKKHHLNEITDVTSGPSCTTDGDCN